MKLFFCLIINFSAGTLFGQEMYCEQDAELITTFPFKQLNGGVILVKAKFNNIKDTFNFILDTGSGGISLDSTTTDKYLIKHIPSGKYLYGIAGVRKVDFAPKQKLSFQGLTVDSLDFYINNYDILTQVYGIKIDGIIGFSFLSRYIVKVDFDSLKIDVYSPGFMRYPPGGMMLHPVFKGLPIIPLMIEDAKKCTQNYFFDTGAGLCFLLGNHLVEDSSILLKKRNPLLVEVQGMGGKKRMRLTLIKELQIGNYKFRRVPTYLYEDDYNLLAYPQRAGLIGDDILRRFNLVIDYPHKRIHLTPNAHFYDPFDYSYTGMTMYNQDSTVFIDDIVKRSPADKAGLKNGDIVMAIGHNFSGDVEVYKNLLQKTGSKVSILIMRNKVPSLHHIRVGRIK